MCVSMYGVCVCVCVCESTEADWGKSIMNARWPGDGLSVALTAKQPHMYFLASSTRPQLYTGLSYTAIVCRYNVNAGGGWSIMMYYWAQINTLQFM